MASTTLLPCLEGIQIDSIAAPCNAIIVQLSSVAPYVACPLCGQLAARVHSHYPRTLADMPWNHVAVRIHLRARKLFCDNPACARRVFTEPVPGLAARYARKTLRLQDALYLIGYIVGGRAGERIAAGLGLTVSPDTLLRRVRHVTTEKTVAPSELHVVGIDDWAFRKGHQYGTILVDLQCRCPVDLLPDRSSESVAAWLKAHPEIEVVSRDRAQVYAQAAREGAPQSEQVVDRWHLLRNLGEAIERLTAQQAPHLRQAARQNQEAKRETPPLKETVPAPVSRVEQRRLARCGEREAHYNKVKALRQQRLTAQAIAIEMGISVRTVQRFLQAEQFPARARRRHWGQADRYETYLRERLEAGCHNAAQLYREIQSQGFTGCYSSVSAIVSRLRSQMSSLHKARSPAGSRDDTPPSKRVAWWLQGHLSADAEEAERQKAYLARLYTLAPVLKQAGELAAEFAHLMKKRQRDKLDAWLEKALQSACNEVRLFAQGLRQDLPAVRNAFSSEWSNGQTEGQVNRLKMLKRQMYGRANFDLLRARVLPMAQSA